MEGITGFTSKNIPEYIRSNYTNIFFIYDSSIVAKIHEEKDYIFHFGDFDSGYIKVRRGDRPLVILYHSEETGKIIIELLDFEKHITY